MHHVQLFTAYRFGYLYYCRIIYYKLELLDFIITLGNYFIPFPFYQGIYGSFSLLQGVCYYPQGVHSIFLNVQGSD